MENLDWDLQAVVARGSCSSSAFADIMENPPDLFDPLRFGDHHHHHHHLQDDQLLNFPSDFLETTAPDFDWFEGIYNKPFCSGQLQHQRPPLSPQSMLTTTQLATSISAPEEVKKPKKESKKQPISDVAVSDRSNNTTGKATIQAPKSKRGRRNQCKRVVHHVVADGLSNDMWAWRKYGQKPVKGSPYPRSYYRCSSLKGCLARKQVERSSSDPSMFIVTYTAEHSHSHPTRRSALAGTTRTKVPMIRDTAIPSPQIPSVASTEHEVVQPVSIETGQEVQQILEDSTSGNFNVMPSLIFADELFPSLDDFEGLLFDFR